MKVKRGDIYYADLGNNYIGSEEGGIRPVVIIQNDIGNSFSTTVIVAPITSKLKRKLPTHVPVQLEQDSEIMLEQIRTIDKKRLKEKKTSCDSKTMERIDYAIRISLNV